MDALTVPEPNGVFTELGLSRDTGDLIGAVKEGLPVAIFRALAETLNISEARLARVTGISPTSLTRRKRSGVLTQDEGEHVLRIATLFDKATALFEDVETASDWLKTANPSLGDATPLSYADTELGGREVENLLGRIEYGVYS